MKRFLVGIAFVASLATNLPAQSIYGTLTGIVSDPQQAVIANAELKLRDEKSGSQRTTLTNTDGYYTFASVPPGIYELTVGAQGSKPTRRPASRSAAATNSTSTSA